LIAKTARWADQIGSTDGHELVEQYQTRAGQSACLAPWGLYPATKFSRHNAGPGAGARKTLEGAATSVGCRSPTKPRVDASATATTRGCSREGLFPRDARRESRYDKGAAFYRQFI